MNQIHQPQSQDSPVEGKDVYINFYGPIEFNIAQGLMDLCFRLVSQGAKSLYFLLASPGGEINTGIELYNFLKSLPIHIVMHNMSAIDSIATVVFLSGDERYACPNSSFLFHGAKTTFLKDTSFDVRQINERASSLEKDEEKIKGIITNSTSITEVEMDEFFVSGQATDLNFAEKKGLINGVKMPDIGRDAPFVNINIATNAPLVIPKKS